MTDSIYILTELMGSVVCLMAALVLYHYRSTFGKTTADRLIFVETVTALLLSADALSWYYTGLTGPAAYFGIRITNYLIYCLSYTFLIAVTNFIMSDGENSAVLMRLKSLSYAISALGLTLVTVSQFTGTFYTFSSDNVYEANAASWVLIALGAVGIIFNIIAALIRLRLEVPLENVSFTEEISLHASGDKDFYIRIAVYLMIPVAALVVQIAFPQISLLALSLSLSSLLILMTIYGRLNEIRSERAQALLAMWEEILPGDQKLKEMQNRLVLSQIQPHFLYNSLNVIHMLIEEDPGEAKAAISAFSDYLQGDIRSLKGNSMIHFSEEMAHVRSYLQLEKIRFGDELVIAEDLDGNDFYLPSLTVLPIVENAVRHGIRKSDTASHLTVRSRETDRGWTVTVIDDGVGFNPDNLTASAADDAHTDHPTSIARVRERLSSLCQGTLTYISSPGTGTIAAIHIPKE